MVSKPLMVLFEGKPFDFCLLCEHLIIRPHAVNPTRLGAATSGPVARFNQIMCKFLKSKLWWGIIKKNLPGEQFKAIKDKCVESQLKLDWHSTKGQFLPFHMLPRRLADI